VPRAVFPPEVRAQATALACSLPGDQGVALARWSSGEIARRLVALELVARIAPNTVSRWLRQEKLKPWRYHTWQHIIDPQVFLERARPVLWLYQSAAAWLEAGVWIVCVDEKTSIQARAAEQPIAPAMVEQPVHISPRYQRGGALNLFAGLSVADGYVYGQCQARKRFIEFQGFILDQIIPTALERKVETLVLILDNGSTHAPKRFEAWLEAQIMANHWPLAIQVYWLPKNASWLDQIEIWFSVLQRKRLQPNDFKDLTVLEQAILAFIAHCDEFAQPIHWSYTVEKLEHKLSMN
jgi:transposase